MRKRFLPLLLLSSTALAQAPSPGQLGLIVDTPNVVQVLDSNKVWSTIGTIDPATDLFSAYNTIADAPTGSGVLYGRRNASWTTLLHTDITDWAVTLVAYAPLNSPIFAGSPSLPTGAIGVTQAASDNSTKLATTAFVNSVLATGTEEIIAGTTPTSGYTAGNFLTSDGTKTQADGLFTSFPAAPNGPVVRLGPLNAFMGAPSSSSYPLVVLTTDNTNGGGGWPAIGFQLGNFGWGGPGIVLSTGAYVGFENPGYFTALPEISLFRSGVRDLGVVSTSAPTSPSSFDVYNIFSDNYNGEWGTFDWQTTPNTLTIGTEANGTGTQRPVNIVGNPVNINGVKAGTITANSTPTSAFGVNEVMYSDGTKAQSSGGASYLVQSSGLVELLSYPWIGYSVNNSWGSAGIGISVNKGYTTASDGYGFGRGNWAYADVDAALFSPGPATVGVWDHLVQTTPTAFHVYDTYTDASNGIWGTFDWTTHPGYLTIGPEGNGTGGRTGVIFSGTYYDNAFDIGASNGAYIAFHAPLMLVDVPGINTGNAPLSAVGFAAGTGGANAPAVTPSGGTCAVGTAVGVASVGTIVLTGVCAAGNTLAFINLPVSVNGWNCDAHDRTTQTALFVESASTTSGFTLKTGAVSSVAGDVLQWKCMGY
jgi:hypothetical protein